MRGIRHAANPADMRGNFNLSHEKSSSKYSSQELAHHLIIQEAQELGFLTSVLIQQGMFVILPIIQVPLHMIFSTINSITSMIYWHSFLTAPCDIHTSCWMIYFSQYQQPFLHKTFYTFSNNNMRSSHEEYFWHIPCVWSLLSIV